MLQLGRDCEALLDQLRHRTHGTLDRNRDICAMLIVQIDIVDAQPLERLVALLFDVLRIAFPSCHCETKLGGEEDRRAFLWISFKPGPRGLEYSEHRR